MSDHSLRPIFLLSPPRAGSTLVQRVLASYPEIASVSEPWLLVPFMYTLGNRETDTNYWHVTMIGAVHDFFDNLPGGREAYYEELRHFARRLYSRAGAPEARYFLDKTPGYHVIAHEIGHVFPDAVLIFLWRNPLAMLASSIEVWSDGRWQPGHFSIDLHAGVSNLVRAQQLYGDRALVVRYEDLIQGDQAGWRRIAEHIGVDFREETLQDFASVRLEGRMGDPTGQHLYSSLSTAPLDKWRSTLDNPIRRAWAERYLRWLGEERLAVMGYDLEDLLDQLRATHMRPGRMALDLVDLLNYRLREPVVRRALRRFEAPPFVT